MDSNQIELNKTTLKTATTNLNHPCSLKTTDVKEFVDQHEGPTEDVNELNISRIIVPAENMDNRPINLPTVENLTLNLNNSCVGLDQTSGEKDNLESNQEDSSTASLMESQVIIDDSVNNTICSVPQMVFESLETITGAWNEFSNMKASHEVFLKGCKWSPDGTCLLTNSNDSFMRLFDLPLELYNCHRLPDFGFPELKPSVKSKIGGLVYDYEWYPLMTSTNPDTCCFITTSFCNPVHLWDAFSGNLRCSYRGFNKQDELEAAKSVVFDPSGELLLCGYKNSIKIFHTAVPGRDFINMSTKELCEQKGIVSCIAVNPSMPNIFAVGTYTKNIGLYSVDGHAMCLMTGLSGGGVTQLMFSKDGSKLFSAGRKDSEILCWDLRNLGSILWVLRRPHTTNQRIYMDLSPDDHYILSGSTDGDVYVWDLQAATTSSSSPDVRIIEPLTRWHAHNDCVNGLSIHRHIPVVATASGQRFVPYMVEDDDDDDLKFVVEPPKDKYENSIKLWWAGRAGVTTSVNHHVNN